MRMCGYPVMSKEGAKPIASRAQYRSPAENLFIICYPDKLIFTQINRCLYRRLYNAGFAFTFIFGRLNHFYQFTATYKLTSAVIVCLKSSCYNPP